MLVRSNHKGKHTKKSLLSFLFVKLLCVIRLTTKIYIKCQLQLYTCHYRPPAFEAMVTVTLKMASCYHKHLLGGTMFTYLHKIRYVQGDPKMTKKVKYL